MFADIAYSVQISLSKVKNTGLFPKSTAKGVFEFIIVAMFLVPAMTVLVWFVGYMTGIYIASRAEIVTAVVISGTALLIMAVSYLHPAIEN